MKPGIAKIFEKKPGIAEIFPKKQVISKINDIAGFFLCTIEKNRAQRYTEKEN